MEQKVTMLVELTVEAPASKDKEEVDGVVYWKAISNIEAVIGQTLDRGVVIKKFDIDII